jgi:hypothetical protein
MNGQSNVESPSGKETSTSEDGLVMSPLVGLILALLAGLTVWGALELIMPVFQLSERLQGLSGNVPEAQQQELFAALKVNAERNAVLSLVLLASTVALVLSVTELLHRRAGLRVAWGGVLAGVIAGVVALGAGAIAIELHEALRLEGNRLGKTLVVQGVMLGLTGLGIGLAIAAPLFRPRLLLTCLAGCLIGGLLAALIFPIAAGICLPHVNTDYLVPESGMGRLVWAVLATGLIGVAATGLGKRKKKERATAT